MLANVVWYYPVKEGALHAYDAFPYVVVASILIEVAALRLISKPWRRTRDGSVQASWIVVLLYVLVANAISSVVGFFWLGGVGPQERRLGGMLFIALLATVVIEGAFYLKLLQCNRLKLVLTVLLANALTYAVFYEVLIYRRGW